MTVKYFVILFGVVSLCLAEIKLDLDSGAVNGKWTVTNSNGSISVPGSVPGGIYTDLQAAGILGEDLFYRFNDIEYRWVGYENWTYSLTFEVPEEIPTYTSVNLVFDGLDTVGSVYLNGQLIGDFSNMFLRYVFDVKNDIQVGSNELNVVFTSPIAAGLAKHQEQASSYDIPPLCAAAAQRGECHINYLRKMQASFSWDWGPAFPSVGLWKSAHLEAYDYIVVRDVTVNMEHVDGSWELNIQAYGDVTNSTNVSVITVLELNSIGGNGGVRLQITHSLEAGHPTGRNLLLNEERIIAPDSIIELWWPNGYGSQTLSNLTTIVHSDDTNETSTLNVKFGFRTIRLVQDEVQQGLKGNTFYFEVNGIPVFAKGSNWIPGHVLPELGYNEKNIRYLLTSARDVHTNMIRVWGGGVYESDIFYEIADELGIMIWQDFMFAVALYPTDDKFINSVKEEVEQQVKRLQHHASIAVWAGNNENEAGLRGGWWFEVFQNFTIYYNDYVKLYVETIKPIVNGLDRTRSYTVSSPSNGVETEEEGYVAQDPYSPLYGDTHYYNYLSDGWDSNTFPNTRFASEYGFQSLPAYKTMAAVSTPEDRSIQSNFSQSRQHHANGYSEMAGLIRRHLPLPEDDGSEEYYKTYIYYSQISQAMSIKVETEKFRSSRNSSVESEGGVIGLTMGALYWQLNDVWEAPTWASIDYHGNWKMLHYFAKRFFAPILASPRLTPDGDLLVHITSDLLEPKNLTLMLMVHQYDNLTPLYETMDDVTVEPLSSLVYKQLTLSDLLNQALCPAPAEKSCFVHIMLFDTNSTDTYPDNYIFPSSLTDAVGLNKPNIKAACESISSGSLQLTLQTDTVAPFVWLEVDAIGQFSDNGFLMTHEETNVTFTSDDQSLQCVDILPTLSIRSVIA